MRFYPTYLSNSYSEASASLRVENIPYTSADIAARFALTLEQSSVMENLFNSPAIEGELKPVEKAIFYSATLSKICDGKYTITNQKTNHHLTIELSTIVNPNSKNLGKRTLAILVGSDYVKVAYFDNRKGISSLWNTEAAKEAIYQIKQKYSTFSWDCFVKLANSLLIKGLESSFKKLGFTVEASRNCLVCGHPLTNPSSLNFNLGNVCYEKIHGKRRGQNDKRTAK